MSAKDYVVHENDTTRQDVMNTSSSAAAAAAPTE
jgi:hypothetical protein